MSTWKPIKIAPKYQRILMKINNDDEIPSGVYVGMLSAAARNNIRREWLRFDFGIHGAHPIEFYPNKNFTWTEVPE